MYRYYIISLFILSCSSTSQSLQKEHDVEEKKADVVSIETDTLQSLLHSVAQLTSDAQIKFSEGDTLAAEALVSEAMDLYSDLSDTDREKLLEDTLALHLEESLTALKQTLNTEGVDESDLSAEADDIRNQILVSDDDSAVESTVLESGDPQYEIPVVTNTKVENAIKYFTERDRGRRVFQAWLENGHQYEEMIRKILREEGVPSDLYYLGMIESGYNPRARSWASAVGPWQFIQATGKYYGLHASYWVDDRRDVENATRAAARHLRDLYKRFDDWYLAMAGYNCNPAKIARRVREQGTKDYFKLRRIPRETKGYVPNFLATMIIAKDLEKYGFTKPVSKPIVYDRIYIKDVIDLNHIATAADTTYDYIRDLNPAIIKWVTPSDRDSMYLNVPVGMADQILAHIDTIPNDQKRKYVRYRIKSGDALSLISRKYGISMSEIRRINNMHSNNIREGRYLLIPVPANDYYRAVAQTPVYKKKTVRKKVSPPASTKGLVKISYTVKSGNTLGEIAEIHATKAQNIRDWNGLSFRQSIRVGQELTIWVPNGFKPIKNWQKQYEPDFSKYAYHKVTNGDSLWDISKKYDVPVPKLRKLNNLADNSIMVGSYLIIKAK
jgi:membrane-bound lytic murein transglycosylase D